MKPLKRKQMQLYYYFDDKKIDGANPKLWGDCSGLWGDCSDLNGDCTGLNGDCTGLWGNLNEIPMDERNEKPDLSSWVEK